MVNNELFKKGIVILDENNYIKKVKGMKRYFIKSYKHLIFKIIPELSRTGKSDGSYSVEIPIDDYFKKTYGNLELYFSIKNDVVIIEDILPSEILIQCHMKDLPIYHGIPYYQEKDLVKLKILEGINER